MSRNSREADAVQEEDVQDLVEAIVTEIRQILSASCVGHKTQWHKMSPCVSFAEKI